MPKIGRTQLICFVLATITLALYWPATTFPFSHCDDPEYILKNTAIQTGITSQSIAWAFQNFYSANWHPLTWLSHALDWQLYGSGAGGHHLTNLLIHAANAILLFLALQAMTESTWRSALVAALFAWHPLHVESVVWVAERKDVLSSLFFLLGVAAYTGYVRRVVGRGARGVKVGTECGFIFYILSLFLFACALMSKPMAVTLPCVLLLLDYWPLNRVEGLKPVVSSLHKGSSSAARPAGADQESATSFSQFKNRKSRLKILFPLFAEKLPFFFLSALSCLGTVWAQHAALVDLTILPFRDRLVNAVQSYGLYLWKAFWPMNLILYPYWQEPAVSKAFWAGTAFLAISALVLWQARRRSYLIVGWLWFAGMLVPVIGLIQVGYQRMADRYTYLPLIGVFIMAVWGVGEWVNGRVGEKTSQVVSRQAGVTSSGSFIHLPGHQPTQLRALLTVLATTILASCLICSYRQLQYWRDPVTLLGHAVAVTGGSACSEQDLGYLLEQAGDVEQAEIHYRRALELPPDRSEPVGQGHLRAGLNLAGLLAGQGKWAEAEDGFRLALKDAPAYYPARSNLGDCLVELGRLDEAVGEYRKALRTGGAASPVVWGRLAIALNRLGKSDEALKAYREALRLSPNDPQALNELAWFLATDPHAELRNGVEAVALAQRACQLTRWSEPRCLGTLDAAYAEAGRFEDAISAAQQTRELALASGQTELATMAAQRLDLYRTGRPYHRSQ